MIWGTFKFNWVSPGCYRVRYTTPKRGDYYEAIIREMPLIDRTLHAELPKQVDIKRLVRRIKHDGLHYNKRNEIIG